MRYLLTSILFWYILIACTTQFTSDIGQKDQFSVAEDNKPRYQKEFNDAQLKIIENLRTKIGSRDYSQIKFYQSSEKFFETKKKQRIVLMTTKGSINYTKFKFKPDDTILFGRESAGVPEKVHKIIKNRLKIPMNNQVRSLNIASSVAIVLAESLRQIELI